MNERIEQLAKQAGFSTELSEAMATRHNTTSGLEKFAELIVRECLVVINQSNGVGNDDVIRISTDVEKHFGVKND